jgi:hypothetical protein
MNTNPPSRELPGGWKGIYMHAVDRNGTKVDTGTRVRVLSVSTEWLNDMSPWTRRQALAMVGEAYEVEEIDRDDGRARVRKEWVDEEEQCSWEIFLNLTAEEMEVVG